MPVIPGTSCAEPTLTWVEKEKTGASGLSQTMKVQPLGRVFTVTFFSKSARLWAEAGSAAAAPRKTASARSPAACLPGEELFMVTSQKKRVGCSGPVARQGQVDDFLDERRITAPGFLGRQSDFRLGV